MGEIIRIGMDTSKRFFQLHGVDAQEKPLLRKAFSPAQVVAFFKSSTPVTVGLEASHAAHHWARTLSEMGHTVKILPPQLVKPFVARSKTDAADGRAVCIAMTRPEIHPIPIKTRDEQARLMLLSMRERLVRERTRLSNTIRGHGAEFGCVVAQGLAHLPRLIEMISAAQDIPDEAKALFDEMWREFTVLNARLAALEVKGRAASRADARAAPGHDPGRGRHHRPHLFAESSGCGGIFQPAQFRRLAWVDAKGSVKRWKGAARCDHSGGRSRSAQPPVHGRDGTSEGGQAPPGKGVEMAFWAHGPQDLETSRRRARQQDRADHLETSAQQRGL
jgi:transposase